MSLSWDPSRVLNFRCYHGRLFFCSGHRNNSSVRCSWQMEEQGSQRIQTLLDTIASVHPSEAHLHLPTLAEASLCKHHGGQAGGTISNWSASIQCYLDEIARQRQLSSTRFHVESSDKVSLVGEKMDKWNNSAYISVRESKVEDQGLLETAVSRKRKCSCMAGLAEILRRTKHRILRRLQRNPRGQYRPLRFLYRAQLTHPD